MKQIPTTITSSSSSTPSFSIHPDATSVGRSATTGGIAMSISRKLREYLDREHVHYDVLPHDDAFRALAIAQVLHTPEKEMAKVVSVKVENLFVMTVFTASWQVAVRPVRR